MEKSSEKLIRDASPKRNPFNEMLSEVHLKLPSTEAKNKKIQNIALEYDPYIDRNSYKYLQDSKETTPNFKANSKPRPKDPANVIINAPMPTKNSSDVVKQQKTRSQLINQWIAEYMHKKSLMGPHWEYKFKLRQYQLLQESFMAIKYCRLQADYTFNNFSRFYQNKKMEIMVNLLKRCEHLKIKDAFQCLVSFYKDQILFGLSNTLGSFKQAKDSETSQFLKLQSDCKAHEKFAHYLKEEISSRKNSDRDLSLDFRSNKMRSNRGSQSGTPSEDLSALILNHNKLHLQGSLNNLSASQHTINNSQPNIPKPKANSSKHILTNKSIGELCLQTTKRINTIKKLDSEDLPLDSKKHILEAKLDRLKGKESQVQVDHIEESSASKQENNNTPITVTYILKNLDLQQLPSQKERDHNLNQQKKTQPIDFINRVPIAESFYQPAAKVQNNQPQKNVFFQLIDTQPQANRSISLQIRPQPRFISPEREPQPKPQNRFVQSNQYYPEEPSQRQSFKMIRHPLPYPQEKPRAHSATPKIKFTFTTSQPCAQAITKQNLNKINVTQLGYQQFDCIKQNSILQGSHNPKESKVFGSQFSKNSLPKQSKINGKIRNEKRQHIKDIILPPAYDQYYTHSDHHHHRNSIKVPFLSGSNTSTALNSHFKDYQPQASNQQFGIVAPKRPTLQLQPSNDDHPQARQKCHLGRAKSPKEKILVTCSSKGKI